MAGFNENADKKIKISSVRNGSMYCTGILFL